ncbi:hypothetical protein [Streptomyces sp. CA-111067]|uniref:hypothetical protein n=1 Tax=Streptomyces sp. CA-111067 TaxID=3240046 RepID=UPI003D95290E
MSEVELVAAALAAGATAGFSETVQRVARDAWRRVTAGVGRGRGAAEQPAGGPDEAAASGDGPCRRGRAGRPATIVAHEIRGVVLGDNARQNNHFH